MVRNMLLGIGPSMATIQVKNSTMVVKFTSTNTARQVRSALPNSEAELLPC